MKSVTRLLGMAAALACALSSFTPVSAQVVKPPTDATKVLLSKSGYLNFDFGAGELAMTQSVRDFDALVSFTNPTFANWLYGIEFRAQNPRSLVFMVDFNGKAGLFMSTNTLTPIGELADVPGLQKKAGQRNDFALYARGDRLDVFVNKVFFKTYPIGQLMAPGEVSIFAGDTKNDKFGKVQYSNFVVRVSKTEVVAKSADPVQRTARDQITLTLQRTSYIQWGRPIGMDRPDQGCNSFDDKRPVRQFQASLRIKNNGAKPMNLWYPVFFKPDGSEAYVCFYAYREALQPLGPGQIRDITFAVFVELNEMVSSAVIRDKDLGISNRVMFK